MDKRERYFVCEVPKTGPDLKSIDSLCFRVKDKVTDDTLPGEYATHAEAQDEADRLNGIS